MNGALESEGGSERLFDYRSLCAWVRKRSRVKEEARIQVAVVSGDSYGSSESEDTLLKLLCVLQRGQNCKHLHKSQCLMVC